MKKILIVLVLFSIITPFATRAEENNSRSIADLERTIKELTQKLEVLRKKDNSSVAGWCFSFNRDLGVGASGRDVRELNTALGKEGFLIASPATLATPIGDYNPERNIYGTDRYTEATAATVSLFQEKYRSEILTASGLSAPTGYFGPATRKKMNSLYGCNVIRPIFGNRPPSINGVEGPTVLKIGEQGTWTVRASDPENGSLSYSVVWGDESEMAYGSPVAPRLSAVQQTATFTHTYFQAGTYYPKFKVTDNVGQSNRTSLSVSVGYAPVINRPPTLDETSRALDRLVMGTGEEITPNFIARDPDGDKLVMSVDWGDGAATSAACLYSSTSGAGQNFGAQALTAEHVWTTVGTYQVKATISDCRGGQVSHSFEVEVGPLATTTPTTP